MRTTRPHQVSSNDRRDTHEYKGAPVFNNDGEQNDNQFETTVAQLIEGGHLDGWAILQHLAWLAHDFTPEELLLEIVEGDRNRLGSAIGYLEMLSLVSATVIGKIKGFNINAEIQDKIVEYATNNPEVSLQTQQLLIDIPILLNKFLPEVTNKHDEKCESATIYVPIVEALFEHDANRGMLLVLSKELALLNAKLGNIYEIIFLDVRKSLGYKEKALVMYQSLYAGPHPDVISAVNSIGIAYAKLGKIKKGLAYFERALAMNRSLYAEHSHEVANSLQIVGMVYEKLGDRNKGLNYLEQALAMRQALYSGNHPDVASSLNSVGVAYDKLENARKGLDYMERSLMMRQALYQGNHLETADSLNNVGVAYHKLGDSKRGLQYLERALAMRQALYQGGHHEVVDSLNNVGVVYNDLEDNKKGLAYLKEARAMKRSLYDDESHPDVASTTNVASKKRKVTSAQEANDLIKGKQLKLNHEDAEDHPSSSGKEREYESVAEGPTPILQEGQDARPEQKKSNQNSDHKGDHAQMTSQGTDQGAKQVEGYYSNNDVMILLDGLLKRSGFVRVTGGQTQDIVKNLLTGESTKTMVLAPIAEDSVEAVNWLIKDINRAHENNVEQILVPINIPNVHWYTLQLCILPIQHGYAIDATIHDSLGIRKNSIIVENLIVYGASIAKRIEGNLPKIQGGEFGARNVYCGGYTARLIANLALNNNIDDESAWGCLDNRDHILRREDMDIVNEHNPANANNFGKESMLGDVVVREAVDRSLLRNFIAKEKKLKLLQEFKKIYKKLTQETKAFIKSISIPSDPAGIFSLVRNLYATMPSVLGILFQVNVQGEIEKDAEGLLKLDSNLEVEQVRKIVVEFQTMYHRLEQAEATVVAHPNDKRFMYNGVDVSKELNYCEHGLAMDQTLYQSNHPTVAASLSAVGITHHKLGNVRKALGYWEGGLAMNRALYQGNHPEVARSFNNVGVAYYDLGDVRKALNHFENALTMKQALYQGNHHEVAKSLSNVGAAYGKLGDIRKGLDYKERALIMMQALYPGDHQDIAASLNNIGIAYDELGDVRKGLDYKERALIMMQALYSGNHQHIVISLNNVGVGYKKLGDIKKANDYSKRAKAMKQALDAEVQQKQVDKEEFKGQGTLNYADNKCFEYYNSKIDKILNLRITGAKFLKSLAIKRLADIEQLVEGVRVEFSKDDHRLVLAPVNLYNMHWVGLLFGRFDTGVEVTYMDSERETMAPWLMEGIKHGLVMDGHQSRFLEATCERQRYGNCGPEMIENFVYYLTGKRPTQEGAVWVHSLLVENSLLDPNEYGLKIEENNKLIGFLSNSEPIAILEIPLLMEQGPSAEGLLVPSMRFNPEKPAVASSFMGGFLYDLGLETFCKKLLYRKELSRFDGMIDDYGIELPSGLSSFDVLLDNSKFNKLIMNRIHPDKNPLGAEIAHEDTLFINDLRNKVTADLNVKQLLDDGIMKANSILHKSSLGFKSLDIVIDSARLIHDPSSSAAWKLARDYAHLYGMIEGANCYSVAISGAEVVYQLHLGEYQKACDSALGTASAMALPAILAMANRPYLGFGYSLFVAATTAYNALENAYSFALELMEGSQGMKDEFMAGQVFGRGYDDAMVFESLYSL